MQRRRQRNCKHCYRNQQNFTKPGRSLHLTTITMSFSSTSSLQSESSDPSTAPQSSQQRPPLQPDFKRLESLFLALINLARRTYSSPTHNEKRSAAAEYLLLHPRLTDFFRKHQDHDYHRAGTYGYLLEMSKLMKLIESGLPVGKREIEALERILRNGENGWWELGEEEREALEKKVCVDVELLVFGGMELDRERLPWNA